MKSFVYSLETKRIKIIMADIESDYEYFDDTYIMDDDASSYIMDDDAATIVSSITDCEELALPCDNSTEDECATDNEGEMKGNKEPTDTRCLFKPKRRRKHTNAANSRERHVVSDEGLLPQFIESEFGNDTELVNKKQRIGMKCPKGDYPESSQEKSEDKIIYHDPSAKVKRKRNRRNCIGNNLCPAEFDEYIVNVFVQTENDEDIAQYLRQGLVKYIVIGVDYLALMVYPLFETIEDGLFKEFFEHIRQRLGIVADKSPDWQDNVNSLTGQAILLQILIYAFELAIRKWNQTNQPGMLDAEVNCNHFHSCKEAGHNWFCFMKTWISLLTVADLEMGHTHCLHVVLKAEFKHAAMLNIENTQKIQPLQTRGKRKQKSPNGSQKKELSYVLSKSDFSNAIKCVKESTLFSFIELIRYDKNADVTRRKVSTKEGVYYESVPNIHNAIDSYDESNSFDVLPDVPEDHVGKRMKTSSETEETKIKSLTRIKLEYSNTSTVAEYNRRVLLLTKCIIKAREKILAESKVQFTTILEFFDIYRYLPGEDNRCLWETLKITETAYMIFVNKTKLYFNLTGQKEYGDSKTFWRKMKLDNSKVRVLRSEEYAPEERPYPGITPPQILRAVLLNEGDNPDIWYVNVTSKRKKPQKIVKNSSGRGRSRTFERVELRDQESVDLNEKSNEPTINDTSTVPKEKKWCIMKREDVQNWINDKIGPNNMKRIYNPQVELEKSGNLGRCLIFLPRREWETAMKNSGRFTNQKHPVCTSTHYVVAAIRYLAKYDTTKLVKLANETSVKIKKILNTDTWNTIFDVKDNSFRIIERTGSVGECNNEGWLCHIEGDKSRSVRIITDCKMLVTLLSSFGGTLPTPKISSSNPGNAAAVMRPSYSHLGVNAPSFSQNKVCFVLNETRGEKHSNNHHNCLRAIFKEHGSINAESIRVNDEIKFTTEVFYGCLEFSPLKPTTMKIKKTTDNKECQSQIKRLALLGKNISKERYYVELRFKDGCRAEICTGTICYNVETKKELASELFSESAMEIDEESPIKNDALLSDDNIKSEELSIICSSDKDDSDKDGTDKVEPIVTRDSIVKIVTCQPKIVIDAFQVYDPLTESNILTSIPVDLDPTVKDKLVEYLYKAREILHDSLRSLAIKVTPNLDSGPLYPDASMDDLFMTIVQEYITFGKRGTIPTCRYIQIASLWILMSFPFVQSACPITCLREYYSLPDSTFILEHRLKLKAQKTESLRQPYSQQESKFISKNSLKMKARYKKNVAKDVSAEEIIASYVESYFSSDWTSGKFTAKDLNFVKWNMKNEFLRIYNRIRDEFMCNSEGGHQIVNAKIVLPQIKEEQSCRRRTVSNRKLNYVVSKHYGLETQSALQTENLILDHLVSCPMDTFSLETKTKIETKLQSLRNCARDLN